MLYLSDILPSWKMIFLRSGFTSHGSCKTITGVVQLRRISVCVAQVEVDFASLSGKCFNDVLRSIILQSFSAVTAIRVIISSSTGLKPI